MPCSYYLPGEEAAIANSKLKEDLDRLTHENDMLREIVLKLATKDDMPAEIWTKINQNQIEHRKEDLARLEKEFRLIAWEYLHSQGPSALTLPGFLEIVARLKLVQEADPKKPLAEQLGFDPDDF